MHHDREHVISVVLNHEEWKEFVKLQPQPVNWLRERIQDVVAERRAAPDGRRLTGAGIGDQGSGISSD